MGKRIVAAILGTLFVLMCVVGCGKTDQAPKQQAAAEASKRDVTATQGVVAAAHPLAAQAGLEVLKKGGNAFDAAVATAFTLGVVEPNASGIGGGGFAIVYVAKEQKSYVIDFREVAPQKGNANFYKRDEKGKILDDALATGWYSAGVPGEVAGMDMINKKFGSMKWADLMQPAIKQAEEGLVISQNLSKITTDEFDRMQKFPSKAFFEKTFIKDGLPVQAGDKVINKDYAKSLKKIAQGGAEVFYKGELADAIAKDYQKNGSGWITKEDLANYQAVLREPLKSTYRGYTIEVVPPPSSGGLTVAEILNVLEGFEITKMGATSADYIHDFIETQKLAFADRSKYMGDPSFIEIPSTGLLNKKYAAQERGQINQQKASDDKVAPGNPNPYEAGSTTSFSIIDKEGNMISVTKSINHFYGGGVVPEGTGIMMNDHMEDFDGALGKINSPEPGKKPLSSMSPVIVLKDGKPFMTLGSPGGPRIISAVANVLVNIIDFGMDIQAAIEAPRYHNPNAKTTDIESSVSQEVIKNLEARGHKFTMKNPLDLFFGGVQGVMYTPDGKLRGGADPRRDGVAVGY
ncbi:gamma-glutamyltransferase [uncultured Anaeromusa sp.]|uniref:gamma-glutamyltransferase n=1 Tax=uncultured Anaeromusa sp. TaxID=673273 RepID=UPI0029C71566|nr:gamma-glutamyltransferase [uncultured Anaeromusa sp.]